MQPLPDDEFLAQHRRRDPVVTSDEVRRALAVVVELNADERTRQEPIRVSVQNDVVVLVGDVSSWVARDTATVVVRAVAGNHDVCNALQVRSRAGAPPDSNEFDAIVAGLRESSAQPVAKRPGARVATHAMAFRPLVLFGLVLPWFLVFVGWSALPMLVAMLAVIAGLLVVHRR